MMMKKSITVAGSIVVDRIKEIDAYPRIGMQANIGSVRRTTGGLVCNTASDLAMFSDDIRVVAMGCVGDDEDGRFAVEEMKRAGVDASRIIEKKNAVTSFTDVMSVPGKERTFFHMSGAGDLFGYDEALLFPIDTDIFHAGYLLMMKKLDMYDPVYGTAMARLLHDVGKMGIRTSVDVVSSERGDYKGIVGSVLPYCDYFIVNEIEAGQTVGISARNCSGKLEEDKVRAILEKLMERGVREISCVHAPEGGFALDKHGSFFKCRSISLPEGYIKGTVGAGDAFCAGMLYGILKDWDISKALDFANKAAACCLSDITASGGMRTESEVWRVADGLSTH